MAVTVMSHCLCGVGHALLCLLGPLLLRSKCCIEVLEDV